ncbi:MAG: hypothetical protein BWY77_01738 [bacterium ADurb.Bin431]|nr:MAG: hypothetical protein BWY77_01738 [bacterium ADurb.Bin431]
MIALLSAMQEGVRKVRTPQSRVVRNPPLVFRQEHADAFLEAYDAVLAAQA